MILAEELYRSSEPDKKCPYLGEQRRSRLFASIVFLGFALESFINEIGLEYYKNDFALLDRLPAQDKWIIIPKLKSRTVLERGKEPFQSIAMIFRYRNLFAHFKPQFKIETSKDYCEMKKIDHGLVKKFYARSIEGMCFLAKEFKLEDSDWLEDKKL